MSNSSDGSEHKTDIVADPGKFEEGMRKAVTAATSASSQIDAQFKKIGDAVSRVNSLILGFTAVLAGGGALKKFISDANEWNGTAGRMASQLGITTQQASVLNTALTRLGIDSDVYVGASQKLSKQVQSNAQAFDVLGVKVRDATGAYRPVTEVMGDVNQKLAEIKNPIEQNIAGQQVYGKGWAEIRTILRLTTAQMQESETRARQLGLIVGPDGVAMSKQYSAQMRDLTLVGKSLEIQFGNALLPVFTRTGAFLSEQGPEAGKVFALVLEGVGFAASSLWLALKDMGDGIGALAAQAAALLSGDLAAVRAIGKARDEEAAKNEAAYERLKARFGQPIQAAAEMPAPPDLTKGPKYTFKPDKDTAAAEEKSRLPVWQAQLEQAKAAVAEQGLVEGQYRERSLAENKEFWAQLLTRQDLTNGERIALTSKLAQTELAGIKEGLDVKLATLQAEGEAYKNNLDEKLRIELQMQAMYAQGTKGYEEAQKRVTAIQRQMVEQDKQVAQLRVDAQRQAQLAGIALEEQILRQEEQLGVVSHDQALQAQIDFEDRRSAIALQALVDRQKLAELDPDRNKVELQRIHGEIEALEQAHQLRLLQLKQQVQMNADRYVVGAVDGVASSFESIVQRIGTQIRSLNDLVRASLQALQQVAMQVLARIAVDWLKQELAIRIFGKASALSKVAEQSAAAGAGGVASMAAAPFPLNLGAPGFGAAMAAAAMAFAPVASAAGGYDIPGTINPIVQAHAREMILPSKISDVIRGMADGGGPAGGATYLSLSLQALDGASVKRVLMDNPAALAAGLKKAIRDAHITPGAAQ